MHGFFHKQFLKVKEKKSLKSKNSKFHGFFYQVTLKKNISYQNAQLNC